MTNQIAQANLPPFQSPFGEIHLYTNPETGEFLFDRQKVLAITGIAGDRPAHGFTDGLQDEVKLEGRWYLPAKTFDFKIACAARIVVLEESRSKRGDGNRRRNKHLTIFSKLSRMGLQYALYASEHGIQLPYTEEGRLK